MPRLAPVLIVAACGIVLPVRSARAQTTLPPEAPKIDASLGFTIGGPPDANVAPACTRLGLPCGDGRSSPDFGVALSVAERLTPSLALVVDGGLIPHRWRPAQSTRGFETNYVRSLVAGPRIGHTFHQGRRDEGRVFAQLLGGAQWNSVTPWRIALQPGAGVDVRIATGRTLRLQYDHGYAPGDGLTFSGPRFQVALVLAPRE